MPRSGAVASSASSPSRRRCTALPVTGPSGPSMDAPPKSLSENMLALAVLRRWRGETETTPRLQDTPATSRSKRRREPWRYPADHSNERRPVVSRRSTLLFLALIGAGAAGIIVAACSEDEGPMFPGVSSELNAQLADLRKAIAPYRQIDAAKAAGYDVAVAHPTSGQTCLAHAQLGGMGVHYLKPGLVDGTVSANAPEVLIYEPRPDGSLELVGVEYVIPFAIRAEDQPAPTLFGQELKHNFTFGLWALHVWVQKDNPSGVFADWNPNVTCQHAGMA